MAPEAQWRGGSPSGITSSPDPPEQKASDVFRGPGAFSSCPVPSGKISSSDPGQKRHDNLPARCNCKCLSLVLP